MLPLTFKQSNSELIVRAAATVLFGTLVRRGTKLVSLSDLAERPQYGFTASAAIEPVGPKFVRITDLQDGRIDWDSVPFCECSEPEKYLLRSDDLLFARTGATTGKTHLVRNPEQAVFASYLIRLRPRKGVFAGFLHGFFQSDTYWSQISEEKEGSAQPNVNGEKLAALQIPLVDSKLQHAIAEFLRCVRRRQDGECVDLPELPAPFAEHRRVVARIEELAAKINEARTLRQQAAEEAEALWERGASKIFDYAVGSYPTGDLADLVTVRGGGTPSKSDPFYWDGQIPWITPKDMKRRELSDAIDHISQRATQESAAKLIEPGAVLVVVRGMILAHTFPSAVLRAQATINQDMKALIPRKNVLPEFLCAHFWARNAQMLELVAKSTHDTRKLETDRLLSARIVVPPLAEQRRIVAELDALQAEVTTLKQLQAETAAELDALLPAILDKAFKGDL